MPGSVALGCLYAAASAVAFGSFAVPVKSKAVLAAKVHPIVFQFYKSTATLLTALLTLFFVDAVFTLWGLLGAAMWVFTGTVAIVAITHAGMGLSQAIWCGVSSLVAFIWGAAIFHEEIWNLPLSIVGLVILTVGVAGLGLAAAIGYAPEAEQPGSRALKPDKDCEDGVATPAAPTTGSWPPDEEEERMLQGPSSAMEVEASTGSDASASHAQAAVQDTEHPSRQLQHFLLGISCAVIVGLAAGSFLVPFKYANDVKGLAYILSFGIGAVLSSVVWVSIYFPACWLAGRPSPSFHVEVAAVPALVAGTLWSLGNLFSILAVEQLGLSISGPLIQCQLVISNLWAIFYYHELQTRASQITVCISTAILLLGGFLVAYFGT